MKLQSHLFEKLKIPINLCLALGTLLAIAACTGESTPPRDLLLHPSDFPDQSLTQSLETIDDSLLDGPAVLVKLNGPVFNILESLVLFESEVLALNVLAEIKQDQLTQGVFSNPEKGFDDHSGIMYETLNGEDGSTLFFVEGRALVRIAVTGENHPDKIWEIARIARKKSAN